MLCNTCRRVVALSARQTCRQSRAAISSKAPLIQGMTRLIRTSPSTRLPISSSSFLQNYSTTSDAAAAASPSAEPSGPQKPDYLDPAETEIWNKLMAEFEPTELMVQDISGGCGSMYGIEIASDKFRGANMLKQQRMVNAVLGEQMKGWHGVQLRTKVPS